MERNWYQSLGTPRKGLGASHWGTPQKGHGTSGSIMGWRWGTPIDVDRHTPVKTVPSRRTTYAGGKNAHLLRLRK